MNSWETLKLETHHTPEETFLKFLGFSVAAATLAACEAPVIKAVPYVNKPEDIVPGVANWYASAFYDGTGFANLLVKTREGRPIFIKGNKQQGITKGSTNPRIVASVLSLYDSARLTGPMANGKAGDWKDIDKQLGDELEAIAERGGKIRILSSTVISPGLFASIEAFKAKYGVVVEEVSSEEDLTEEINAEVVDPVVPEEETPVVSSGGNGDVKHIQYDSVSYNAIRLANEESFGEASIPDYDFSKAKTIVSIGADFLATWLMANEYAPQYGVTRNPEKVKKENAWMSRHHHFEANMSITGANADYRTPVKPSEFGAVAAAILEGLGGSSTGVNVPGEIAASVEKVVEDLKSSGKDSLVVSGSSDKNVQIIVNAINEKLGAYSSTINLNNPVNAFNGNDKEVSALVQEVIGGKGIDALLIFGVNPVYSLPNGEEFGEGLSNVGLTVSFSGYEDETSSRCQYICPDHHYLEGWNDYNPKKNHYALAQPVIRPLFDTQSVSETLAVWAGTTKRGNSVKERKDSRYDHDVIQGLWLKYGYPNYAGQYDSETDYWNWMVHNGGILCPLMRQNRRL